MIGLRSLLRRSERGFAPLERRVLDAVAAALDGEARERFEQQVQAVNKVQRLGGAREVNLYRMRGGKPFNDPGIAFADARLEAELARVSLRVPGEERRRTVTLHLVRGFVFSLTFDPPAAPVLDRDDAEVVDVRLRTRPMEAREPVADPGPADAEPLAGRLARWHERYGLSEVSAPLPPDGRARRLREIPVDLPHDYLRMMEQTDGFIVGPWKVFGLREVYGITPDRSEYEVIAELRDRGVLAVETETADLYFVPFDGAPRRSVDGLVEELESQLTPADAVV